MTEALIDVHALCKNYDGILAVDQLSFQVPSGQILGLVGPNGAGKTTTLLCLAGILPSASGSILIAGAHIEREPLQAKRELAFIPDTPKLFEYLTVRQHLQFVARLYGVEDWKSRGMSLLEEFELIAKVDVLPHELSRGMQQKLAICCAFLHQPKAIFCDEPLTGLDPLGIRNMKASIARRAEEEGAAIIVSSHQLELVRELSDALLILNQGRAVVCGKMEEIRAQMPDLPEEATVEDIFFHVIGEAAE